MKKIKILRIIARLNVGGPAIHSILISAYLDNSRFETLLVHGSTGKGEGDMSYYMEGKNIATYFMPELKREPKFIDDYTSFRKISRLIKEFRPDIIHTHTAKAGAVGRLAGMLYNFLHPRSRIKLIHTFHGHVFEGYFGKFKTGIFLLIERFLAYFSDKLVTVSDSLKNELVSLKIGNKDKIKVIPLGFDLAKFLAIPGKAVENRTINIGIVGRLAPVKNHRLFLQAAQRISELNTKEKMNFFIVGDGELRQELEIYAHDLGISGSVKFLGWQRDLPKIYTDILDIVMLTSFNEGTPVSLIEAMASSRLVLAVDVGGVKDLLGREICEYKSVNSSFRVMERGVLINPANPENFSTAVAFLLKNAVLRQNIISNAKEYTRSVFTRERLVQDIEKLYLDILKVSSQ
ncbi:MAG: glycosyltransferase [Candidatus Omnitrophica bacterium]|nr:glycosyltransferase [Candidatus Omnitrophota bacterium]